MATSNSRFFLVSKVIKYMSCYIIDMYFVVLKTQTVRITPLPSLSGRLVERYLRIVNFFVIRESTSIREVRLL